MQRCRLSPLNEDEDACVSESGADAPSLNLVIAPTIFFVSDGDDNFGLCAKMLLAMDVAVKKTAFISGSGGDQRGSKSGLSWVDFDCFYFLSGRTVFLWKRHVWVHLPFAS